MNKSRYLESIASLRASIGRGELYQTNYTFPIAVESDTAPRDLYRHIAARHPAAHGAFIDDGARSMLSLSPELFVARSAELRVGNACVRTCRSGWSPYP